MYKHKPGIQMDVKGFNESVNITDKKIKNVRHIAYDVIETMLCEQEKKDKNLKFRLDGHQNLVLDDLALIHLCIYPRGAAGASKLHGGILYLSSLFTFL